MSNQILAVVNGNNITRDDLNRFMMQLGNNAARYANPEGEKVLVQELVNQELFLAEAVDLDFSNEEAFKELFEAEKAQILKQYAVRKCLSEAVIDEAEVEAHYEANKEQFKKPEQVKASHILVDTEEKASEILEKLNGGLSFAEAANEYSSCPSKERGGDLGFFGRGQMVPEFEMAAYEIEVGVVSQPVKTQFGYHLILKTDQEQGGYLTLDEVSFDLMKDLTMQKQNELYIAKVEALRGQYKVELL